ncbi:MAG: starch-binding protein [Alistipes sp.]|nr:starch-binding protein [Alistipes sp.]
MKLVKFFAVAVAAVAMLAACEPNNNQGGNQGGGVITQETLKVYANVEATDWTTVGVWAWNDAEGANYTGGNWPGEQLTETEIVDGKTCYVWNAPKEIAGKEIGFIVNDFGTNGKQTVDLKLVVEDGAMVVLTSEGSDGKWLASVNGEETEEPEPQPEPVLVLGEHTWGLIGSFNEWSADVAMEIVDGWAVGTITVDANAEFKVRADGGWTDSYGFAATEEMPAFPVDGTQFVATYNGGNLKVAEAGTYEVSFTIEGENEYFKVLKK